MTVLGVLTTILFAIAAIANLLAISGGGLVLPPFKSLYWLQTPKTFVGLYGGCPNIAADGFFALTSDWRILQGSCWQFFKLGESTIDGTLDKIQSLVFFILFCIAFILNISSLIMFSSHDYRMAGIVSIIAFVVHTTCFGFTLNSFLAISRDFYDSSIIYGWRTYLGPGLYVSAGADLLSLIAGLISLGIYYKGRSTDYKGLSDML